MITKCPCQQCGVNIEFDVEAANQFVPCPSCGKQTRLLMPGQAPKPTPSIQASHASYIHENLMPSEVVTAATVLHWVVYLQIIPAAILALFVAYLLWSAMDDGHPILVFILAEIFMVAPAALGAFINKKTSEFAVTNKRVLMKCGFIRRSSVEIMLTKIESIKVNQGILGRILDYGTIMVCGTGGTKDPFHKIANPLKFRQMIQMEIEKTGDKK